MKCLPLYITLLLLVSCLLPSCISVRPYSIATLGAENTPYSSLFYNGKDTSALYASANVFSSSNAYHRKESNFFARFDLHKTHVHKMGAYSYGAFGYRGSYSIRDFEPFEGHKNFYGLGARTEALLRLQLGNVQIEPIGIGLSFLHEGGSFRRFRRRANRSGYIIDGSPGWLDLNLSALNKVSWRLANKKSLGVNFALGKNFSNKSIDNLTFVSGFHLQLDDTYIRFALAEGSLGRSNQSLLMLGIQFKLR